MLQPERSDVLKCRGSRLCRDRSIDRAQEEEKQYPDRGGKVQRVSQRHGALGLISGV